ncbi:MAG TPA: FAD-dependent thymidylate synthase [Candidatus Andersenbacteria bacterium]|nr:FAD-dependent thymidylate synthase [Candidatus Andersenbacteria bacterium]
MKRYLIMAEEHKLDAFAPLFAADSYTAAERGQLAPFFTNLTRSVYAPLIFSPEVIGALCSRASRAAGDLRRVFLDEYITPFLAHEDDAYGQELRELIAFLQAHPIEQIFSNPRARSFYAKWLAQYGDDSIAQMAGTHLVFGALSQVAIKYFEDQRIGLAPIEKSTRYVDYSAKVNGQYLYYVDPTLTDLGLEAEYRSAMDGLFETYAALKAPLMAWITQQFPEEKPGVVEKKAFDTLRGLLPAATLSQVAFFGNGQAFEYMIARSAGYRLGEIRWASAAAFVELSRVVPAFLRRLRDPDSLSLAEEYQTYKAKQNQRVAPLAQQHLADVQPARGEAGPRVTLVDFDPEGEIKIVAAMLYSASANRAPWAETVDAVRRLSTAAKREIIAQYLSGRTQRWQKVGRAFEQAYLRYEIIMNIGAWRDLHRHRMLSQQRQQFSIQYGYDVPSEIIAAGLKDTFRAAIARAESVYENISQKDHELAQYAVTLAHRLRFMQWTSVRECFWEMELRTIPEGHGDYRLIEHEKFRLFAQVYPLLAEHMRVNLGAYDFARRGQEEKIEAKLRSLAKSVV